MPTIKQVPASRVAILMCTYNGQRFLAQQLDSIDKQRHPDWVLWASDDGSSDGTVNILSDRQQRWPDGQLHILNGPARGVTCNFLSLVCNPQITADYFAYADQDDVWHSDKLTRALRWLDTVPRDTPALYCARTRYIDADGQAMGLSPLCTKPPGFAHALTQNIAGGNTMMFNQAARQLLLQAGPDVPVAIHDWWTYLAVAGGGGQVYYDDQPCLDYRQHDHNQIGMNTGVKARLRRLHQLWDGHQKTRTNHHLAALKRLDAFLPTDSRALLDAFSAARQQALIPRILGLRRCGLYRQTRLGSLGLLLAAVLGKI